jgi:hypothetical protein
MPLPTYHITKEITRRALSSSSSRNSSVLFKLFRMDDNANTYVVDMFAIRRQAEQRLQLLTSMNGRFMPHHQSYWIEANTTTATTDDDLGNK